MGSGTSKSFESSSSFAPKGGSLADHVVLRGRTEPSTTLLRVILDQSVEGDELIDDVATHVDDRISRSSRGSTHTPVSTWDASAASNVRRHRDVAVTSHRDHHPSLRLVIEPQASLTSCPSMSITDNTCCGIAPMCEAGEEEVRPPPAPGSRPTGLRLVIGQQSSLVSVDIRPCEEEMLRSTHVATTAAHSMNSLLLDEQEQQQQQQPHQSAHMSSFRPLRVVEQEDSEYSFHQTNSWTVHSALVGEEEEQNRQQHHNSVWFMEEGGDGGGAFRHILSKQPTGNVSAVGEPQLFDEGALLVDSHSALAESV